MKPCLFIFVAALMAGAASAQLVDIATNATDPNNRVDSEPSIAVNPVNPQQIAVVTFSEGWSAASSTRAPVWMSANGGATWTKNFVLTAPTAGSTAPGDQNLVYSANGTLFLVELGLGVAVPRCFYYRPSGGNWIAGTAYGDDQPMIGSAANTRLSPWLNFAAAPVQSTVERTNDDGVTVAQVGVGSTAFPNRTTRIAIGPGNQAYIIYKTRQGVAGQFETAVFRVARSTDFGVTWNSPGVPVHPGTVTTWFTTQWGNNQNGGKFSRARSSDAWVAVQPGSGRIWAVYCNRDASTFGQIYAASSTDSGNTWSAPVRVSDGLRNSAYPEVAVTADGTVGVMYIDFDPTPPQTVYTHRFARSSDNGATWTRTALQSLTTQSLANGVDGFLWGDYEGLTAVGNTFYGAFTGQSIGRAVVQFDPIFFRRVSSPLASSLGTITVDAGRPYAFVLGGDGNSWVDWWSGSAWAWANQGTPPGVAITGPVGATAVDNRSRPYVFVRGSDGNMWVNWWSGSAWAWANQGHPSGTTIANGAGAITVDNARPYAWVIGGDGNLWVDWWSGSAWAWANQGRPSGVNIVRPMGVITVNAGRPYAWILGSDGNLWLNWWSGSAWNWANQGRPAGVTITDAMGAIAVDNNSRPYVFVKGNDGNMWVNWWTGSTWNWANQHTPSGVALGTPMGAITVDGSRPYVFVKGSDNNMWVNWWTGSTWNWANQSRPSGVNIDTPMGAINVDAGRPYVFMKGSDGNLWVNWWSGSAWAWANQGIPNI